jgi:hypothetical protein
LFLFSKKVAVIAGAGTFGVLYGASRNAKVHKLETQRIQSLQNIYDQRLQMPIIDLKKENGMKEISKYVLNC